MGEPTRDIRRFGRHLRSIREARKLSLDAVEELASAYPEQVTKSHLSRIENGQAEPSFRRMYTLGRIYGVSVTSLSEQYELDLERERRPYTGNKTEPSEMLEEAALLKDSGDHLSALELYEILLETAPSVCPGMTLEESRIQLSLHKASCLVQACHYEAAREQAELILDQTGLTVHQKRVAYHLLAIAAFRKGRLEIAAVLLERALNTQGDAAHDQSVKAAILMTQGNIESARDQWESATACYEKAAQFYGELSMEFERCRARRNIGVSFLARGKLKKAREVLLEVIGQAKRRGYERHLALALGDMAMISWRRGDGRMTEKYCRQSNAIARPREYLSLVFQNSYYLWKVAESTGNATASKLNFRTLKSYAHRVDPSLPELLEFNEYLAGGESC